jgi:hypothetical protein
MKNACRIMVGRPVEYYCVEGREVDKIRYVLGKQVWSTGGGLIG